jgi:hypothetical protein
MESLLSPKAKTALFAASIAIAFFVAVIARHWQW